MQEVPYAPGSAWLSKVWNDHFTFDACHPSLQIFPGSIVSTTAVAPTLWTDSFLPNAAIEPVLPDPQKPQEPVGFKEVVATDSQAVNSASLLRRPQARQNTREFVRGSTVSMPFTPGGEAIEAVSTGASKAAEEAATGSWLQELESGNLPRIAAPGLTQGWFGPWDSASAEEVSEKQPGTACTLSLVHAGKAT